MKVYTLCGLTEKDAKTFGEKRAPGRGPFTSANPGPIPPTGCMSKVASLSPFGYYLLLISPVKLTLHSMKWRYSFSIISFDQHYHSFINNVTILFISQDTIAIIQPVKRNLPNLKMNIDRPKRRNFIKLVFFITKNETPLIFECL